MGKLENTVPKETVWAQEACQVYSGIQGSRAVEISALTRVN